MCDGDYGGEGGFSGDSGDGSVGSDADHHTEGGALGPGRGPFVIFDPTRAERGRPSDGDVGDERVLDR